MDIRIANINDLKLIRKIENASFNKFAYSTYELKNMLSQKDSMTLIYEKQIPLGYISFIKVDGIFGEIESIAIIPSAKRTGIGTTLLKEYEKIMIKEGVKRSVLEVRVHNRKAIKFYEKHNYKIIGTLQNFYSISYRRSRDAYLMEKFLF
ncbi:MAG: GNAT family N-acetyltransferase [Thermoplasmata archaeon]